MATAAPPTAAPIGKSELPLECGDVTVADVVDDKGTVKVVVAVLQAPGRAFGPWTVAVTGCVPGAVPCGTVNAPLNPTTREATVPGTGAAGVGWVAVDTVVLSNFTV